MTLISDTFLYIYNFGHNSPALHKIQMQKHAVLIDCNFHLSVLHCLFLTCSSFIRSLQCILNWSQLSVLSMSRCKYIQMCVWHVYTIIITDRENNGFLGHHWSLFFTCIPLWIEISERNQGKKGHHYYEKTMPQSTQVFWGVVGL